MLFLFINKAIRIFTVLERLKQHIINRLGETPDNLDLVLSKFREIRVKRNTQVLNQGEVCKLVYFIAEGCLQVYAYDKEGNETTRDLVTEDHWCSDLISFGSGKPSTENIRTVEACQLFAIDGSSFQEMMTLVPQFDKVYRQILEASYANSVYRINTFVSLSSLERMQWLRQYRPGLMGRVSSKLLASYLGINKDVFSRLKTKL